MDISKLSDWERGARRPCLRHIEALCEVYQRSAEDLGLIKWKRRPALGPQDGLEPSAAESDPAATTPDSAQQGQQGTFTHQQVVEWVYVSVATVVAEALQTLQRHLTALEPRINQSPDVRD